MLSAVQEHLEAMVVLLLQLSIAGTTSMRHTEMKLKYGMRWFGADSSFNGTLVILKTKKAGDTQSWSGARSSATVPEISSICNDFLPTLMTFLGPATGKEEMETTESLEGPEDAADAQLETTLRMCGIRNESSTGVTGTLWSSPTHQLPALVWVG